MTTQEIANRLHELCKDGNYAQAQQELYADIATSTERTPTGEIKTIEGMEGIKAKTAMFQSMVEEVHSSYSNEPKVFGSNIFMEMGLDITMKGMGRMNLTEMCHYVVENGKVISEYFYY